MADLNSCTFTGRITRDAQLSQSGKMSFTSIAIGSFRKEGDDFIEETIFLELKFLGELSAKRASENLKKGKAVWVSGQLKEESWEKDGPQKRNVLIVNQFSLLPLNKREGEAPKAETKPTKKEEKPAVKSEEIEIPF